MYRSLSETMRDPFAINTIAMLQELNIRISKSRVREVFYQKCKDQHIFLLEEFQSILQEFGLITFIAKVSYEKLKTFDPPFLLELSNDQGDEYFTLITKVEKETLHVYDVNEKKTYLMDLSDRFHGRKCMVLLIESFNPAIVEVEFEKRLRKESRDEKSFSRNIHIQKALLTQDDCADIIHFCENKHLFERSLVSKLDLQERVWTGYSHVRTSYSANLEAYPRLSVVTKKIENSLHIKPGHLAPIHCVRYQPSQQFKIHHDAADGDKRVRSVFVYLNQGMKGGETYFPEIAKRVIPETGTCISFPNLDRNLRRIPQSLHASLPVSEGVKYILTAYENLV
jgi:prolyl 4-hydroxylase